jgi:hypothetical protein
MQNLEYQGQKVLTTEMIANELGVDSILITNNFSRNKKRYEEGKHYFLLKSKDLKDFLCTHQIDVSIKTTKIYVWTESGCFNHVKSVGTDESWNSFQKLVDKYFRQREALNAIMDLYSPQLLQHGKREVQVSNSKQVNNYNWTAGGMETTKEYNRLSCKLHTGLTTNQVKAWYLDKENKKRIAAGKRVIKTTPAAKEIVRQNRLEVAACMSLTDEMCKHGANLKEIAPISLACKPAFAKMIELGIIKNEQKKI